MGHKEGECFGSSQWVLEVDVKNRGGGEQEDENAKDKICDKHTQDFNMTRTSIIV